MIMLLHIFIRHNLTNSALEDFLRLINVMVGFSSLPTTYYSFTSYFGTQQFVRHYVCKGCGLYMDENSEEMCNICGKSEKTFFISFDLASAIKTVILRNWEQIQEYKSSLVDGEISDILQGKVARKIYDACNSYNILISFNTDGVAAFNSNIKKSLWPILVTINNLPPVLRYIRKNIIVAGLWLSHGEPDLDIFMKPFLGQLKDLADEGFTVLNDVFCKVITICCCVDSVARCKLQQIKQFNGYEACSFCLHPGYLTENNQVRYKYLECQNRNHQDTVRAMDLCMKRGVTISGIKGVSSLLVIPYFDVIVNCPVDYMHAVFLGVCKQLGGLWFDYSNNEYCIKRHIEKIDNIMSSIRVFQECSRSPRKITDRKMWKANEWQNWLLIYSSVCLRNILPQAYYDHFQLLVEGIQKLLSIHLTEYDIAETGRLLKRFVQGCETLYGIDEMKYNVHLLLHIPACVNNFGPLWAFSLFCFEDMNGVLKKYIKGSNQPIIQIASRCKLAQERDNINLSKIKNQEVQEFCKSLCAAKLKSKCLNPNYKISNQLKSTLGDAMQDNVMEERSLLKWNRFTFKPGKVTFVTNSVHKSDDATFTMQVKDKTVYGTITRILVCNSDNYLIYKPIIIQNEQNLVIGEETNNEVLVKVNNSIRKCVRIHANQKMFIRIIQYVPWVD
ncbi:uncharacterized protein LOC134287586 [Aedes albopictus]|uniref:Transposase domain-containing protein n=1 Tax=Aedes albopictus TaxID=7160 RepID=A0ABM1Y4J6_AEDAL